MLQTWSPYDAGIENPPDVDYQMVQARARGTGGDSIWGRSGRGIE